MSEHTPTPSHEPSGPVRRAWHRWLTVGAVVVAVSGGVTAVAVIANSDGEAGAPATSRTVTTSVTTPPTSSTTTPTSTAPTAPTSNQPSAAKALAPFFTAAATLDEQLHDAATAINASGPPWQTVSDEVMSKVRAADLAPVATAIPAGLPPDLLRSVILVYSDLASRRFAMADFSVPLTIDPNSDAYPTNQDVLNHLGNGHAAAARFATDLAATRSLAEATPAVTIPPATSRQTAEVRLHTRYVELANGGCDSRGGKVMTKLPTIVWNGPGNGTVGGIAFTADLGTDATWHIRLNAC